MYGKCFEQIGAGIPLALHLMEASLPVYRKIGPPLAAAKKVSLTKYRWLKGGSCWKLKWSVVVLCVCSRYCDNGSTSECPALNVMPMSSAAARIARETAAISILNGVALQTIVTWVVRTQRSYHLTRRQRACCSPMCAALFVGAVLGGPESLQALDLLQHSLPALRVVLNPNCELSDPSTGASRLPECCHDETESGEAATAKAICACLDGWIAANEPAVCYVVLDSTDLSEYFAEECYLMVPTLDEEVAEILLDRFASCPLLSEHLIRLAVRPSASVQQLLDAFSAMAGLPYTDEAMAMRVSVAPALLPRLIDAIGHEQAPMHCAIGHEQAQSKGACALGSLLAAEAVLPELRATEGALDRVVSSLADMLGSSRLYSQLDAALALGPLVAGLEQAELEKHAPRVVPLLSQRCCHCILYSSRHAARHKLDDMASYCMAAVHRILSRDEVMSCHLPAGDTGGSVTELAQAALLVLHAAVKPADPQSSGGFPPTTMVLIRSPRDEDSSTRKPAVCYLSHECLLEVAPLALRLIAQLCADDAVLQTLLALEEPKCLLVLGRYRGIYLGEDTGLAEAVIGQLLTRNRAVK